MSKEKPSENWGGARQGSGRKTLGEKDRVSVYFRVNASTKELIYAEAERLGISPGQLIDRLIKERNQ